MHNNVYPWCWRPWRSFPNQDVYCPPPPHTGLLWRGPSVKIKTLDPSSLRVPGALALTWRSARQEARRRSLGKHRLPPWCCWSRSGCRCTETRSLAGEWTRGQSVAGLWGRSAKPSRKDGVRLSWTKNKTLKHSVVFQILFYVWWCHSLRYKSMNLKNNIETMILQIFVR